MLAFAVVMLNTDAHNPKTDPKTKMSEDAFVAMAREGMKNPNPSSKSVVVEGGDDAVLGDEKNAREASATDRPRATLSLIHI